MRSRSTFEEEIWVRPGRGLAWVGKWIAGDLGPANHVTAASMRVPVEPDSGARAFGDFTRVGRDHGSRLRPVLGVALLLLLLSCAPRGSGGSTLSAAQASGRGACVADDQGRINTLIVDLQPEQRSDIEAAARRGLVVARFDCQALAVLPRCEAPGSYRFDGNAPKEQLIRMNDAQQISSTLPLTGSALAANLAGALSSGSSLDLALVMVGKLTADRAVYSTDDLRGDCAGVTHILHSVTLGAFALSTGSRSESRTVAGVFGAGVSASSAESKNVSTRDGSIEQCAAARSNDPSAPDGCAAALRIQLLRVEQPLPPMAIVSEGLASDLRGTVCPVPDDCRVRCQEGDATACRDWGLLLSIGDRVPRDLGRSTTAYQRACELDDVLACTLIGLALITRGPRADLERGHTLLERACERGNAVACRAKGTAARNKGHEDAARRYFKRGCDLGDVDACDEALGKR